MPAAEKRSRSNKIKLPGEMREELDSLLRRIEREMVFDPDSVAETALQASFSKEVCNGYAAVLIKYQEVLTPLLAVIDFRDPFLLLKTVLDSSESA